LKDASFLTANALQVLSEEGGKMFRNRIWLIIGGLLLFLVLAFWQPVRAGDKLTRADPWGKMVDRDAAIKKLSSNPGIVFPKRLTLDQKQSLIPARRLNSEVEKGKKSGQLKIK